MRKCLAVFVALWLAWCAEGVSASSLEYQPESISMTIPAGGEGQALVKVTVAGDNPSTFYLLFLNKLVDSNLPAGWLSLSPSITFASGGSSASSLLRIRVPEGTASGVYSGKMLSRAMASHDTALAGNGIRIAVTVPSQCSGIPVVTLDSLQPEVVWPPDHGMTQVVLSGTVRMPEGCMTAEAGYSIEDEYGVMSGVGTVQLGPGGSFSAALPVEAMRHGQDKDGRHYSITVFVRNEVGTGASLSRTVTVPHDLSAR